MKLVGKLVKKAATGVDFPERLSVFSGITRYAILFINFLMVVCSIALMTTGAIISVSEHKGVGTITDISIGTFAIHVGVVIMVFAMFGCYTVFKGNNTMLHAYSYILVILFLLQIALGFVSFDSIRDNYTLTNKARNEVEKVFYNYVDHYNFEREQTVNSLQQFFHCCGVDGSSFWLSHSDMIPDSCYKNDDRHDGIYSQGCAQCYKKTIMTNIRIVGGFSVGFSVVELFGAIFICFVRNRNPNSF